MRAWLLLIPLLVFAQTPSYFAEGEKYFGAGQYEKAIEPLQKALDQEKRDSALTPEDWHALVNHLATSYRSTGKLTAAEEVLEYGISKDSKYPLFDFTLGAIYGDWNKVYVSIKWLKLALENRNNLAPGEKLPDPRQEQTFERFMKNDDFRAVLREFDALNASSK